MAAQLLSLVNPRSKRRAKVSHKRRAHRAKRSTNPRRRRRSVAVIAAPRRRHRHHVRLSNPRHRRRVRRSNPRFNVSGLKAMIMPAALGAVGAVALDVGLSFLPASTPAVLTSGWGNKALKVAGAVALGYAGGKVLGKDKGKAIAAGALTVVFAGILRDVVKQFAPSVPGLSGSGDYQDQFVYQPSASLRGPEMGAYMPTETAAVNDFKARQMGAYMTNNDGM